MSALSRYHGQVHDSSRVTTINIRKNVNCFKNNSNLCKAQNLQDGKIIHQIRHLFFKGPLSAEDLSGIIEDKEN